MAKATEKGNDNYYILYCCSNCDQKFESKDSMQQHMEVCKKAAETSWIKKEVQEEVTPVVSSKDIAESAHNIACPAKIAPKQTTSVTTTLTRSVNKLTACVSTGANVSVSCSTKIEPSQRTLLVTTNSSQSVMRQSVRQHEETVKMTLSPQYHAAAKNLTASDIIRQRLQGMQSQPPVHKKNSIPGITPVKNILPKASVVNDSVVTSSDHGANSNSIQKNQPIRNILPKAPVASDSAVRTSDSHSFVESSDKSSVPVIERVYYTSTADCDSVGQIKVVEDAMYSPPVTSKAHTKQKHARNVNSLQKYAVSVSGPITLSAAAFVQSHNNPGPNATQSNIQPQHSVLQTLQPSQSLQYLQQNVQQMPTTLIQTPVNLARAPQSLLHRSQPLFQNRQAVIGSNQNVIQQSLLQQNTLLFQSRQTQGNILQNSVIQNNQAGSPFLPYLSPQKTLLPPQKITVQASPCGANILPTNTSALLTTSPATISIPATSSSQAAVVTTSVTAVGKSSQKLQNQILTTANKPLSLLPTSSVPEVVMKQNPVMSVALPVPVATFSHVPGRVNSFLSPQQTQPILPNPNSSSLIWIPACVSSSVSQNLNGLQSSVKTSSSPAVTTFSQTVGGITSVASVKQTHAQVINSSCGGVIWVPGSVVSNTLHNSGQLHPQLNPAAAASRSSDVQANVTEKLQNFSQPKQNQQPDIVFLPPMMPQGHILSGIRIDAPQHLSPVMSQNTNVLSRIPVGAPQPVSSVISQNSNIVSGIPVVGSLTMTSGTANPATGRKTECASSDGMPVSMLKKANASKCKKVSSKSQKLGTKVQGTCLSSESIGVRGKHGRILSPSVTLSFYVKGNADHYTAAQMTMIMEPKVSQIAKMLFSEKLTEPGPVILDDGRQIFPINYTGPYTPKDTKTFARKKKDNLPWVIKSKEDFFVGMFENTDSVDKSAKKVKKNENPDITIQTIKLPGQTVWLFKDFDCPKILWKVNLNDSQVLALPLEHDLPGEVMTEIQEILRKSERTLIPLSDLQTLGMKGEAQINCLAVFPKEKIEPSDGMVRSSQDMRLHTSSTPIIQCVTTTSHMSILESKPSKENSCVTPQGKMPPAMSELKLPEQLTVRADAKIVQRALEAFVLLERIFLTESLQKQLKAHSTAKKITRDLQPVPLKTGKVEIIQQKYKPRWLQTSQGEILLPSDQMCQVKFGGSGSLSSEMHEVNAGDSPGRPRRGRPRQEHRNKDNTRMLSDNVHENKEGETETVIKDTEQMEADGKNRPERGESESSETCDVNTGGSPEKKRRGRPRLSNTNKDNTQVLLGNLACETEIQKMEIVFRGSEQMNIDGNNKPVDIESEKQILQTEMKGEHVAMTRTKTEMMQKSQESINTEEKSRKRKTSSTADRLEFESSVSYEKGVRRSVRIFKQPKANYRLREQQYDFIDREDYLINELKAGTSEGSHLGKGDRRLGKVPEFDIYIDFDAVEGEDDEQHMTADDRHDQDMVEEELGEGTDFHTAEQFMKVHIGDFEKVILKKSKNDCESENGARGHVLYSCTICGCYQSRSVNDFTFHLKQHYSGELSCKICGKFTAAYKEELTEHEALEHTGKPLYHCQICSAQFFSLGVFKNHMKRHSASFPCKVCCLNFPSENDLHVHHVKEHSKQFVCHLCNLELETEEQVRSHYSSCIDGYQCCLCYVKKAIKSELQNHMKEKHGHKGTVSFCSFEHCGACFLTTEELESHASGHIN